MQSKSLKTKYRDKILKRGYYNASILYLQNFQYGKNNCPLCQKEKYTFILPGNGEFELLCTDCLETAQIEFSHDTEKGIVSNKALLADTPDAYNIHKHVAQSAIDKLLDTPEFSTIQGGLWKLHCNDFMQFQGVWEPSDFTKCSNNTGKSLFLEMTDEYCNHLWDEMGLDENETTNSWEDEGIEYYAFKCLHCNAHKGFWEY